MEHPDITNARARWNKEKKRWRRLVMTSVIYPELIYKSRISNNWDFTIEQAIVACEESVRRAFDAYLHAIANTPTQLTLEMD